MRALWCQGYFSPRARAPPSPEAGPETIGQRQQRFRSISRCRPTTTGAVTASSSENGKSVLSKRKLFRHQ